MTRLSKRQLFHELKCGVCLFCIGGFLYNIIEVLWRGYSHWTMFFVGGACFPASGGLVKKIDDSLLFHRCALCALAVTSVEFFSGCLFNLKMKLNVWDYSGMFLNVKGQVCLLYSVLWGFLSLIAMPIYANCRTRLEGGEPKLPTLRFLTGKKAESTEEAAAE